MEFFKIVLVITIFLSLMYLVVGKTLPQKAKKTQKDKDKEALAKFVEKKAKGHNHVSDIWAINKLKGVSDLVEGDMRVPSDWKLKRGRRLGPFRFKRNAVLYRTAVWRLRSIPYLIDASLDQNARTVIQSAISEVNSVSCVQWVAKTSQSYYVKFVKENGCWSWVGKTDDAAGFQKISIGEGCAYKGTVMHEMFHAMGFFHEQSRTDRDSYVTINWPNIEQGAEAQFHMQTVSDSQGIGYDYSSIMHYEKTAFSKYPYNLVTIQAKNSPSMPLGGEVLTNSDKEELRKLYECTTLSGWSQWSIYGPCSGGWKWRSRFCVSSDLSLCPGGDGSGYEWGYLAC